MHLAGYNHPKISHKKREFKIEEILSIFRKILYNNNSNFNVGTIVIYFLNIKVHGDDLREEVLIYTVQLSYLLC